MSFERPKRAESPVEIHPAPGRQTGRAAGRGTPVQRRYAGLPRPHGPGAADTAWLPVQRSAVADDAIDAPREESIQEDRATIDAGESPISPKQLARAQQRNPHWATRLGHGPADFASSAAPDSAQFARDVARFQQTRGLAVDGIAGPRTHAAAVGARAPDDAAAGGGSGARDDAGAADRLEPGLLGPRDELEPGVLGPQDELEPGVLGPRDELEPGLIGMNDPLFGGGGGGQRGGQADQLEPGLIGMNDPLFGGGDGGQRGGQADQLEPGLIGMNDPLFGGGGGGQRGGQADQLEPGLIDEAVQQKSETAVDDPSQVHAAAQHGISGAAGELPHRPQIEASLGRDLSFITAHVGGAGSEATAAMGATAYATGDHVVFGQQPDLHTAAHEATHVLQQQGGVQLAGGVGAAGDRYEQQADAVADKVVRGEPAVVGADESAHSTAHSVQQKESGYSRRDNTTLVRLALQQAAALAVAGKQQPTAGACYGVADALRYAAESLDVPQHKGAVLRSLFKPADLAYVRAAELHDAAAAALGEEASATSAVLAAMHDLWGTLSPAGWRRPANPRDARGRAKRAQRAGSKQSFGSGDRASLVSKGLMTASHFIRNLVGAGKPVTPGALEVTTNAAHTHIEYAFDQMVASDDDFAPVRATIDDCTRQVVELEHQALVVNKRPAELADTRALAESIREMVGLAGLPAAQMTADEFASSLHAVHALLGQVGSRLGEIVGATSEAYATAWSRHTATLQAQKRQKLQDALLKRAIATALVGGLGGVAAHVMKVKIGLDDKSSVLHAAVIDGAKDLTKMMAKKGVGVPTNVDGLAAFPLDPVVFQARAQRASAAEMQVLWETVRLWRVALAEGRLIDRSFNPHELYVEKLTVAGSQVLQTPVPDVASESRVFEREFWRVWLENYAYTVSTSYSLLRGNQVSDDPFAPRVAVDVDQNWGQEIIEAINALGEDGAAWVEQYGGVSKTAAEARKARLDRNLSKGIVEA